MILYLHLWINALHSIRLQYTIINKTAPAPWTNSSFLFWLRHRRCSFGFHFHRLRCWRRLRDRWLFWSLRFVHRSRSQDLRHLPRCQLETLGILADWRCWLTIYWHLSACEQHVSMPAKMPSLICHCSLEKKKNVPSKPPFQKRLLHHRLGRSNFLKSLVLASWLGCRCVTNSFKSLCRAFIWESVPSQACLDGVREKETQIWLGATVLQLTRPSC